MRRCFYTYFKEDRKLFRKCVRIRIEYEVVEKIEDGIYLLYEYIYSVAYSQVTDRLERDVKACMFYHTGPYTRIYNMYTFVSLNIITLFRLCARSILNAMLLFCFFFFFPYMQ